MTNAEVVALLQTRAETLRAAISRETGVLTSHPFLVRIPSAYVRATIDERGAVLAVVATARVEEATRLTRQDAETVAAAVTLCGRIEADATTDDGRAHQRPTCPTCAKRDPRGRTGGPFVLASMLQLGGGGNA